MSLKFNQPQSQYVMTKREALELIAKTYPGQMKVTANERSLTGKLPNTFIMLKELG